MKVSRCVSVLLCATVALGFPIRVLFTGDTPTIVSERSEISRIQKLRAGQSHVPRPTFQEYIARLRSASEATGSNTGETADAKIPQDQRDSHSTPYGSFVGKLIPTDNPEVAKPPTKQTWTSNGIITYLNPADFFEIIDNHGPESVALGLFVLAPIAYFILELLELAIKSCIRERYPRRGRDPVRLVGPERQLRAWSNQQREMQVKSENWWTRRARS
ncbi:uncharacterized protein N7498_007271 [Penicillium cinerascens]|uniref:Uncharacterized protein n=1 Tax=Penicillium cinerascens TaxID=70096 RepID=A0A9W9JKU3_9EURO|nr:uncharacterized protein N7498_007271 [Penicillium cinerascens]KAJ5198154.1 hypothetical protein N7498_007271 [Penicillium cinerascens]